ncbi:MAG: SEC-C domain-containing protein, partial [Chloroflexi bacterium]|nr:SEC-C domain-containing protein [Chloroflexota bacterium]
FTIDVLPPFRAGQSLEERNREIRARAIAPSFSARIIQDQLRDRTPRALAPIILRPAQRALALHRRHLIEQILPELLPPLRERYAERWREVEDMATNLLRTKKEEFEERQARSSREIKLDAREVVKATSAELDLRLDISIDPRAAWDRALDEKILAAVRYAYNARVGANAVRHIRTRTGINAAFPLDPLGIAQELEARVARLGALPATKTDDLILKIEMLDLLLTVLRPWIDLAHAEKYEQARALIRAARLDYTPARVQEFTRAVAELLKTKDAFTPLFGAELEFETVEWQLAQIVRQTWRVNAENYSNEIKRELAELFAPRAESNAENRNGSDAAEEKADTEIANPMRVASGLMTISQPARSLGLVRRGDRQIEALQSGFRFPWHQLAARAIKTVEAETLRETAREFADDSFAQLVKARGGPDAFNNQLRELMLSVVTNLWVDYLTQIEALRAGIGLEAIGQRNPLVEYRTRASAMFSELYGRIRTQVLANIFAYQYQGLTKLAAKERDVSAQPIQAPPRVSAPAQPARASSPKSLPEPMSARVSTAPGALGRNDPCWCGSGKKYKHCHMNSDVPQGAGRAR